MRAVAVLTAVLACSGQLSAQEPGLVNPIDSNMLAGPGRWATQLSWLLGLSPKALETLQERALSALRQFELKTVCAEWAAVLDSG